MKKHIWIGGITIIAIIGCVFIYLQYTLLDKNKDLIQEEGYFLSKKTSISKEELENSKSFFLYEQSTYREERQLYYDSLSEDSYLELIHGVTPVEKTDFVIPYKVISLEGFNNLSIDEICNGRLLASFFSENQDQLLGEHQRGRVIYDLEKEEILFTILPDDCNYSVISDALSENYIYWCEAVPYTGAYWETWTLKGMDFRTRNSFTICKVGDFENIGDPNIGSCYQDALYFYLNTEEEITKEYPDLEIQSITDMVYGYDLICYNPEEKLLSKKTEFNFGYNPYAYPCITEDYIYTVDYDGTNWYILSYHISTDTYIRYQVLLDLDYKSEYIQGLEASSDYIVYHTNFSRYFLLDLHTLEVREISKNLFSWYGIIKDKLFFLDGGFIYCYDISENKCYKLLKEGDFENLICQDNICGISNGDGKIYLFYP